MRRSSIIWLIILGLMILGAGIAAWSLREPISYAWHLINRPVKTESIVRFAVVGDNHGDNPIYQEIIRQIKGQSYDFLLNLGDATQDGTSVELATVKQLEDTLPFPVYHTVGSHDIKADPSRQTFINAFGQAACYSLDIKQLHLIVLDNADRLVGFSAACLDWLTTDLADHHPAASVIAYHRPFDLPLASLLGDDETAASTKTNQRFINIIKNSNLKYIFTSHLHTYLPYSVGGVPAVVTGGGGDPAQFVLGGAKNNYFHYLNVTVRDQSVTVTPIRINLTE